MMKAKEIKGNDKTVDAIRDLRQIPGVGASIAQDLININIHSVQELKGMNADRLFDLSNQYAGCVQDRCLLYVFREAIYYAETPAEKRDPEKLKWWNWKDHLKVQSIKKK